MVSPKVCILRSDGANCDEELFYAFEKFGASSVMVHINELRNKSKKLKDFQILALPGGFSYGDDIASGKVLAVELISFLKEELRDFVTRKGLVLGICNGFQTLVRTGLLPFNNLGKMDVTLAQNDSGHFECRWIKIKMEKNKCAFLNQTAEIIDIAVNHGEGKFFAPPAVINKVEYENLVVFRYVDRNGRPTQNYPQNPNGSINAIASVCDPTGRILGMMPHPEKFIEVTQHPNWRRQKFSKPHGVFIFENLIKFAKQQ
jgi:phosphoribosylformylglycinamidine synthase